MNNLIPELQYGIQIQGPPSFHKMVDIALKIEDVLVKRGDISLHRETRQESGLKDKNKWWKSNKDNNKNVVNDGVVDNIKPPTKPNVFNLTSGTQALKAAEKAEEVPPNLVKYMPWVKNKFNFTPLGEPYEMALKTLLANKLLMLLDNSRPYDPEVKPKWWRENEYCEYHHNKGHPTKNCMKLKHDIQDLLDASKIVVGNHTTNADHKAFKEPLPSYEQGGSSKSKGDAKVNYAYMNDDNVINMIESISPEKCNVIIVKNEKG